MYHLKTLRTFFKQESTQTYFWLDRSFYPLNIWFFTGMKAEAGGVYSSIAVYFGSGEQKCAIWKAQENIP